MQVLTLYSRLMLPIIDSVTLAFKLRTLVNKFCVKLHHAVWNIQHRHFIWDSWKSPFASKTNKAIRELLMSFCMACRVVPEVIVTVTFKRPCSWMRGSVWKFELCWFLGELPRIVLANWAKQPRFCLCYSYILVILSQPTTSSYVSVYCLPVCVPFLSIIICSCLQGTNYSASFWLSYYTFMAVSRRYSTVAITGAAGDTSACLSVAGQLTAWRSSVIKTGML